MTRIVIKHQGRSGGKTLKRFKELKELQQSSVGKWILLFTGHGVGEKYMIRGNYEF